MHESLKKPPVGSHSFGGSEKLNALNWNDLHFFLTCLRHLSFRKAAQILNVSSSTVVRRIERLEVNLGVQLFNRLPEGVSPTSAGKLLVDSVEKMETGAIEILRNSRNLLVEKKTQVSLSVTDWLGTYWILPKLARFQENQPNLMVKLYCSMQLADVLRMESDIAIQFVKPKNPELIVTKLGRIHLYPFASHQYVGKYGKPERIADMQHHMIIDQVTPQTENNLWSRQLGVENIEEMLVIRTNASVATFHAVVRGVGIGFLPNYVLALKAPIVPIDIKLSPHVDIWLTFHPQSRNSDKVVAVINWLRSIFNPKFYPWFRDEFVHPSKIRFEPGEDDIEDWDVEGFPDNPY